MALDFFIRLVAFLINLALYFYGLVQIPSKIVFCFFLLFFYLCVKWKDAQQRQSFADSCVCLVEMLIACRSRGHEKLIDMKNIENLVGTGLSDDGQLRFCIM